jgi:Protein of unknown function DUF262
MQIQNSSYLIVDYLQMLDRGEVIVNSDYQRSAGIWPVLARSFLIETVLRNFPIPKLSLHQKTDPVSLRAHKELVDGQQRTFAIKDFYEGKFRLSSRLEDERLHGKHFEDLDEDDKRQFLNYGIGFDLIVGADDALVREVFRRMNTFTLPLNSEEQRQANFEGPFKWFIRALTNEYAEPFVVAGVFKERGLLRMADAKLLTELAHAYFNGIMTTDKRKLDKVYEDNDKKFDQEGDFGRRLRSALDLILSWDSLRNGPLFSRTYIFYSLVLAMMHAQEPLATLVEQIEPTSGSLVTRNAVGNLELLASALASRDEDEDGDEGEDDTPTAVGQFEEFIKASTAKTNVLDQRLIRTRWLYQALMGSLD